MTALAVLVALVGAMFVAMASAQTAVAPKAPTFETGQGAATDPEYTPAVGDTDAVVGTLTLSWTAPTQGTDNQAVATVTDYDVQYRKLGATKWSDHNADAGTEPADSDAATRTFVIGEDDDAATTNLDPNIRYQFRVRAQVGTGGDAVKGAWSKIVVGTTGQKEALGECGPAQTLQLDATTSGVEPAADGAGENCTVTLESSVIAATENVRVTRTGGDSGVVDFDVADVVADSSTGVVTFTAMKKGTGTYSVSINEDGNLSNTKSVTFTVVDYTAPAAQVDKPDDEIDHPYVAVSLLVDFPQDSDDTIPAGTDTQVRLRLSATDLSGKVEKDATEAKEGEYASLEYEFDVQSLRYVRVSGGLILSAGAETGVVLTEDNLVAKLTPGAKTPHIVTLSAGGEDPSVLDVIVPAGTDDESAVVSATVVASLKVTYMVYTDKVVDGERQTESTARTIYLPANDDGDDFADDIDRTNASRAGSATLTIDDVDEVDSISFDFSTPKRGSDDPGTSEPKVVSIDGGTTEFTLKILNANEKPAQISSVSSVVISTTAGTMSFSGDVTSDLNAGGGQCTGNSTTCELEPSRGAQEALPKDGLKFQLAAPSKTGSADIRAVVISRDGNVLINDDLTVTFVGAAANLEVGEASGTVFGSDLVGTGKGAGNDHDTDGSDDTSNADKDADARDQITFTVDATDKGGNTVATPDLTAKVTGPDGKAVSNDKFDITQTGDLSNNVHLDIDASASKALKAGAHTIKFSAGALSSSSSFTVVGKADKVEIMAGEADEDGQIEVTVTVTDAEGNHVADGTAVEIQAADLRGDRDQVLYLTRSDGKTKAGVAKATFITIGYGPAAIIATADGKTDVHRVTSTFDAPVVVEEEPEVASLSCLSNLSGFSTWTCEVEASASEIFGWISSRGATALHLSSAGMWVRYSVVESTLVPGSSDFTVTKNDILYISN